MIREEWYRLGEMSIENKLRNLKKPLRVWNKEKFGSIDQNISKFEYELACLKVKQEMDEFDVVDEARQIAL